MPEQAEDHFVGKIAQKAIIVRDGKALICRAGKDVDVWELPGGRLHVNEKPEDGLAREILEELGVKIRIGTVVYIEQFIHTRTQALHLLICYQAELLNPNDKFRFADNEVAEVRWISREEINNQKIYQNCLNALYAYWSK